MDEFITMMKDQIKRRRFRMDRETEDKYADYRSMHNLKASSHLVASILVVYVLSFVFMRDTLLMGFSIRFALNLLFLGAFNTAIKLRLKSNLIKNMLVTFYMAYLQIQVLLFSTVDGGSISAFGLLMVFFTIYVTAFKVQWYELLFQQVFIVMTGAILSLMLSEADYFLEMMNMIILPSIVIHFVRYMVYKNDTLRFNMMTEYMKEREKLELSMLAGNLGYVDMDLTTMKMSITNNQWKEWLPDEVDIFDIPRITGEENAKRILDGILASYRNGDTYMKVRFSVDSADEEKHFEIIGKPTKYDAEMKPLIANGILKDTTEEVRTLHRLSQSRSKYKAIFENMQDVYFETDIEGNILLVSPSVEEIVGISVEEVKRYKMQNFYKTSEEREAFMKELERNKRVTNRPMDFIKPNGEEVHSLLSAEVFHEQDKFIIRGTLKDITERTLMLRKLDKQANYDELTNIMNRRAGFNVLNEWIRHPEAKFTICFVDINYLKYVNDTFGHTFGDMLIQSVAKVFRETIREEDVVFRVGGDEIIIAFINITEEQAAEIWKRILKRLDMINEKNLYPFEISVSHGFVSYEKEFNFSLEEYVKIAEDKMYEEKKRIKALKKIDYEDDRLG